MVTVMMSQAVTDIRPSYQLVRLFTEIMKGDMVVEPLMIVQIVLSSTETMPSHHSLVSVYF